MGVVSVPDCSLEEGKEEAVVDSAECCPLQEAWRSHRGLVLGGSRGMEKWDIRITAGKAGPAGPLEVT